MMVLPWFRGEAMPRIYDVNPAAAGELRGHGEVHIRTHSEAAWKKVKVTRLEFDEDSDEGQATVSEICTNDDGTMLFNSSRSDVVRRTFRALARYTPFTGEPPPEIVEPIIVNHATQAECKCGHWVELEPFPDDGDKFVLACVKCGHVATVTMHQG